jgi:cobalamin biosynthetic protein CobC
VPPLTKPLEHGGGIRAAARARGIPSEDWLDLSTGINPAGWPVPPVPPEVWQRLPEAEDGLEAAGRAYYRNPHLLAVPGSQAAIRILPTLFPKAAVTFLTPLYAEHPRAWHAAGHAVLDAAAGNLEAALATNTPYLLLCNPNNPTAHRFTRDQILAAAERLARRDGWLIVDEAFADAEPELSASPLAGTPEYPKLIVLRSPGKFFGLAGLRIGFVLAAPTLLTQLAARLDPWAVSHPARWITAQALRDTAWQTANIAHLQTARDRLIRLLTPLTQQPPTATSLFVTLTQNADAASALFDFLSERAILIRHFPQAHLLRFGLPGNPEQWERLQAALALVSVKK